MTSRIEELKTLIKNKELSITHVKNKMRNFEIEVSNEQYDKHLDEIYGDVECGGVTAKASSFIFCYDEGAYNEGKNNYIDSLDKEDQDDYKELESELEDLENELEDLEYELATIDDF